MDEPVVDSQAPGTLTLVATPIGNLEDITLRALRTLREADIIAAEDTRRTRKLLSHYRISSRMVSFHAHNEDKSIPALLEALRAGRNVAVVSDAGSPGISDPGYRLVRQAAEHGIPVTAAPGPSAAILSLCLSGFPADRFTFFGFLPRAANESAQVLREAAEIPHTLVFFESPHRIERTLETLLASLRDRRAAVCRELTKKFEETQRGLLSELLDIYRCEEKKRGEFCIVVEGKSKEAEEEQTREERLSAALDALKDHDGTPLKEAARSVAEQHGLSRRDVYQAALRQRRPSAEE